MKKGEQQEMKTPKHRVKPQITANQQPEKQEKTQNNTQILSVKTGSVNKPRRARQSLLREKLNA
jgi:hypothetical protein